MKLKDFRMVNNSTPIPHLSKKDRKFNQEELEKFPLCRISHRYYQWVSFIFVFQGILFMLPRQAWLFLEEGKMESIVKGAKRGYMTKDDKKREKIIDNVKKYIMKETKTAGHRVTNRSGGCV